MTYLFNPAVAIPAIWEMVENIPTAPEHGAIAGGAITDYAFGKGTRDIDVFFSSMDSFRVEKFAKYYKFKDVSLERAKVTYQQFYREEPDSYGHMHKVSIGRSGSHIHKVYKGYLLGYPVELIVINKIDVVKHITKNFDQNIKAAYYNGEYHFSPAFQDAVETGEVKPMRATLNGYIRAWLSAEKYGLKVSSQYDFSRDYCCYAYQTDQLHRIAGEATLKKIAGFEDRMFNHEANESNVILMDVFMKHFIKDRDMWNRLCSMANQEIITEHELTQNYATVQLAETNIAYQQFNKNMGDIFGAHTFNHAGGYPKEITAVLEAMAPLQYLRKKEFMSGKLTLRDGREMKIGRYIHKIMRDHKEAIAMDNVESYWKAALVALENRTTKTSAKVFFSGSKYALTHVSTKTKWSSCQKWGGFMASMPHNYGVLANLSGNTLVAYVADERSDNDSTKWHARVLVRIGVDGSLLLETSYTNRVEYEDEALLKGIQKRLQQDGYNVYITKDEALDFVSKPFIAKPYCDVANVVDVKHDDNGQIVYEGKRQEHDYENRLAAAKKAVISFLQTQKFEYVLTSRTSRVTAFELPEELQEEFMALQKMPFLQYEYRVDFTQPTHERFTIDHGTSIKLVGDSFVVYATQGLHYKYTDEYPMQRYQDIMYKERRAKQAIKYGGTAIAVPLGWGNVAGADYDGDPIAVRVVNPDSNDDLPF